MAIDVCVCVCVCVYRFSRNSTIQDSSIFIYTEHSRQEENSLRTLSGSYISYSSFHVEKIQLQKNTDHVINT